LGYIIDADICIDFLKGQKFAIELFENILKSGSYFISILTYYELLKGAYVEGQRDTVENFASLIDILAINEIIIKIGTIFYWQYRKKGITLSDIDCLIMATAKVRNLKIITHNVKHYPERYLLSDFSLGLK